MLNNKISIDIKSFAELIKGNTIPKAEHTHAESSSISNHDICHVENAQPAFVQRFFGNAITVARQMTGIFEGELKTFNIYQTQRIGLDGFGHWPLPYSHEEVVALLLQNSHSVQVRELLALEIMSVCRTECLPEAMQQHFVEFRMAHQQMKKENLYKMNLYNAVLQNLNLKHEIYSAENFEKLICYLKDLPKPTPNEFKQLKLLVDCQLKEEINFIWFKHFCTEEQIFSLFVQTYLAALRPENSSASAAPFTPSTALLDVLLEVTSPSIRLCIWESQPQHIGQGYCIYIGGRPDAPITHVFRNSDDTAYFELMADIQHPLNLTQSPTQSNSNSLSRSATQYDPTWFGSASKRHKESEVLEEPKDETSNLSNVLTFIF